MSTSTMRSVVPSPMLGHAEEHSALVQAVIRELTAVEAQLGQSVGKATGETQQAMAVARQEVAQACKNVLGAAATAIDAEWCAGDANCDKADLDTLQEAASLRSAAARQRDLAEAQLSSQRGDRAELLHRLEQLAVEGNLATERQEAQAARHAERERRLESQCEACERETEELRHEVLMQGRRLDARNTLTHFFKVQRKGVVRRQERAEQEAMGAKLILQLKRITDAHLAKVQFEQNQIKEEQEELKVWHQEKTQELKEKWEQRQSRHHSEVQELEQDIASLEKSFEARWEDGDKQCRDLLEDQERRAQEAMDQLESALMQQSEVLKGEAEAAKQKSSAQQLDLEEVGDGLEKEMQAQLEVKRCAIAASCDAERGRLDRIRARNDAVTEHVVEEARIFHQGIMYLKETYSGTQRTPRPPPPKLPAVPSPYAATPRQWPASEVLFV